MKILAFDATNNNSDIMVVIDGKILARSCENESLNQAESLVLKIEKCLKESKIWYQDLDLIATTKGPGNFTGIRIGFSVAQAINLALKTPLIALNNLQLIAYDYLDYQGALLVVMDAKLDEFFIEEFVVENGILSKKNSGKNLGPILIRYEEINSHLPKEHFMIVGSGKEIAKDFIKDRNFIISEKEDKIKAINIANLAAEIYGKNQAHDNEILYVRGVNITRPK